MKDQNTFATGSLHESSSRLRERFVDATLVGSGTFGRVHIAHDAQHEYRLVALKTFADEAYTGRIIPGPPCESW